MRYGGSTVRCVAAGALTIGMLTLSTGNALADRNQTAQTERNQTALPERNQTVLPERAPDAAGFRCDYVGTHYTHTKRKAPIRKGMSKHAAIRAMVSKGKAVRYNYTCVSSKDTYWVKTIYPAKGYLYRAHI
ncbi:MULTISPECIES: hypothetical protein [unclassified Streptomyces]|uniref:hypothetical protein n=1 Tax=unclassified Streptomyces TaxID=2593676 RepID=UPI0033C46C56